MFDLVTHNSTLSDEAAKQDLGDGRHNKRMVSCIYSVKFVLMGGMGYMRNKQTSDQKAKH